ncbi:MAG: response regulator [Deltaproteobacteria bacterium]|nr:response regulator [Deltaproteobacteria bacterium]
MAKKEPSHKAKKMMELLPPKLSRQVVLSLVGCVHCGMCNEACHYVLANPDDPTMTPSYKADQLRKIFKANHDWMGKVFPKWVGAKTPVTDEDLEKLKDICFGTCTNCRRCTFNCPMGVDTATLNRLMRGLLTRVGIMPEGVWAVSKDSWEIGNQMGVLMEDYIETLEWVSEEMVDELGDENAAIPIDKKGANIVYTVNPREVKYDPRTITNAAMIFYAAGEDWTMPTWGWDQTNFGLFSGDDVMSGNTYKHLEENFKKLGGNKVVISECGHGYRSTRCEGPNWSATDQDFVMESSVITMINYIKEGKIKVDKSVCSDPVTFHDSCNNARSCGLFEEPRELLNMVCGDFREMYPNRTENYCCTGGGGAMSMSEYTPRRLKSGKVKADQLRATGAKIVVTSCHNCVDGLGDLIKHYELDMEVKQLVDLVAEALILEKKAEVPAEKPAEAASLAGYKILVVDDEADIRTFLSTVMEDNGATVIQAEDGNKALELARKEKPNLMTLDLSMPGKDGGAVYAALRADPELSKLPVCIVTGKPELRKTIYDRDIPRPEGYLDKPVTEKDVLVNVRKILEVGQG